MGASGSQWEKTLHTRCLTFTGLDSKKIVNNVVFTGTFERSLDGKARILLPKRIRAGVDASETLFLTPGTDRCLELHSIESLTQLSLRASQTTAGSKNLKSFSRLFYAQAEQCDIDNQGRIRIPKSLLEYAHLEKDIVIVGVGFNWEIWNVKQWNEYLQSNEDEFDRIASETFDSPVAVSNGPTPVQTFNQTLETTTPKPK